MPGVHCSHCGGTTDFAGPVAAPTPLTCGHCRTVSMVERFPVHGRGLQPVATGAPSGADEATCFVHAEKRAESACDQCGRFMCALCEIRVGDRHLCPQCFGGASSHAQGPVPLERYRSMPARLAFWVALGSGILGPLALIGGPIAIFLAVRGLRRPGSLTGQRHVVLAVLAIILGGLQALFWIAVLIGIGFGAWETWGK